jgi:hypothetical protein
MKKVLIWCLVGLLVLGSAARSQAQTTGGTEKAVAALEEQWLQSQKTNSPDLVAPLLADRFVSTGGRREGHEHGPSVGKRESD